MNLELCTSTLEGVKAAAELNFKRVELCSALELGGLTPSTGLVGSASRLSVEIHVMIRHKSGDFQVTNDDIVIMINLCKGRSGRALVTYTYS